MNLVALLERKVKQKIKLEEEIKAIAAQLGGKKVGQPKVKKVSEKKKVEEVEEIEDRDEE